MHAFEVYKYAQTSCLKPNRLDAAFAQSMAMNSIGGSNTQEMKQRMESSGHHAGGGMQQLGGGVAVGGRADGMRGCPQHHLMVGGSGAAMQAHGSNLAQAGNSLGGMGFGGNMRSQLSHGESWQMLSQHQRNQQEQRQQRLQYMGACGGEGTSIGSMSIPSGMHASSGESAQHAYAHIRPAVNSHNLQGVLGKYGHGMPEVLAVAQSQAGNDGMGNFATSVQPPHLDGSSAMHRGMYGYGDAHRMRMPVVSPQQTDLTGERVGMVRGHGGGGGGGGGEGGEADAGGQGHEGASGKFNHALLQVQVGRFRDSLRVYPCGAILQSKCCLRLCVCVCVYCVCVCSILQQENSNLRAKVLDLQTTLKKIVQGSGGAIAAVGGSGYPQDGGSHPLMQVLEGLEGQAQEGSVSVVVGGSSTFNDLEQPFLNPASALPLYSASSPDASGKPWSGSGEGSGDWGQGAHASSVTADQATGAANVLRMFGDQGKGAGVGVGAKRVAGVCGIDVLPMFNSDAEMMEGTGAGTGGQLEEGECKRARIAADHQKEVMLVFNGDLATCDRAVISAKLQSLRRLLIKRHDSARLTAGASQGAGAGNEPDKTAAAQLLLRIHLLTLDGLPKPMPHERLWVLVDEALPAESQERLRSGCSLCLCVCVWFVCASILWTHNCPWASADSNCVCQKSSKCVPLSRTCPSKNRTFASSS
jgi:hypothetical protein